MSNWYCSASQGDKCDVCLLFAQNAAKRRSSYRDRNGAVSIDLPECNVHVTQLEGAEEEPIILVLVYCPFEISFPGTCCFPLQIWVLCGES